MQFCFSMNLFYFCILKIEIIKDTDDVNGTSSGCPDEYF